MSDELQKPEDLESVRDELLDSLEHCRHLLAEYRSRLRQPSLPANNDNEVES